MQRMLFARLLLQDARVIVLDEPFNAIDAKTSADLLELVRRWHSEQRTVLAAMHDLELVKANFPETLLLAREPVAWGATAEVLTPDNMLKARRMCEAFDEQAEACVVAAVVDRMLYDILIAPFADFEFMRRALVGTLCAGARRGADRRVPDAAAHEPDRRRHGARHPARRRDRLPGRGAEPVRHGGRRADRRLRRRASAPA